MLSTSSIVGHGGSKCLSGVCSSCILFASSSGIKRARWLQCRTKTATTAPLWPGACSIYSPTLRRHALQLPTTYVTVLFTPQPHIPTARSLLSSEHTTNETASSSYLQGLSPWTWKDYPSHSGASRFSSRRSSSSRGCRSLLTAVTRRRLQGRAGSTGRPSTRLWRARWCSPPSSPPTSTIRRLGSC